MGINLYIIKMSSNKYLIMIGPAGCGKGTQCEFLVKKLGFEQLSTGDMLRAAVAEGSELGKIAGALMKEGKLVNDDLVIGIIKDKLATIPDKSVLFDGFPRTLIQANKLDEMLSEKGFEIT